jgi:MFS family permease
MGGKSTQVTLPPSHPFTLSPCHPVTLSPCHLSTRGLIIICLAALAWAFSFGLGAPLASLWLKDSGFSERTVGLNTGVYYLGICITCFAIPWLMRRSGPNCVAVGCLLSAATVAAFPFSASLTGYYLIRMVNGIAGAITLIPMETYINRDSPPICRSRNFGYYALSVAVGWALGNFVGLELYPLAPELAFLLGGLAAAIAGILILVWLPGWLSSEDGYLGRAPVHLKRNFFSFGTAWCQGFLEGGMIGFLALYLRDFMRLHEDRISWLTSSIMIGVILVQVPVGWFADRLGRRQVLYACYGVVIVGLVFLPFCGNSIWLATWLFLVGACSGSFYPLGLAMLGERLPPSSLARANAWFLAINCLGSWMGPSLMGEAVRHFDMRALFTVALASVLVIPTACLFLRTRSTRPALSAVVHSVSEYSKAA